jgi:hypothetical protein
MTGRGLDNQALLKQPIRQKPQDIEFEDKIQAMVAERTPRKASIYAAGGGGMGFMC